MRRLRRTESLRALVRETTLEPGDLIYPLFICPGEGVRNAVSSMPGVFNLSIDEAVRETNLAMTLRPNEATVLYNAACTFANLGRNADAIDALRKAWEAGYKDAEWTRRDPDLAPLHGDPEFEKLYPPAAS